MPGAEWRPHLVDDWAKDANDELLLPPRTWADELNAVSTGVTQAIQLRNETIRAARRAGLTFPQIGAHVGMTKQGITYHIKD